MRIFAGLSKTDYEEVFRAIGALVDERGWRNITVMKVDEGLVLQVSPSPSYKEGAPGLETYLLTDGDVERVMREALLRRQREIEQVMAEPDNTDEPARPATPQPAVRDLAPPPPASAAADSPNGAGAAERAPERAEERDWHAITDNLPLPNFEEVLDTAPPGCRPGSEPLAPLPDNFGEAPFAPTPLNVATSDPITPEGIDPGAARAAVVMAHIVSARLRSGVPMTGDDPDLVSLLEQVRALDGVGIGKG